MPRSHHHVKQSREWPRKAMLAKCSGTWLSRGCYGVSVANISNSSNICHVTATYKPCGCHAKWLSRGNYGISVPWQLWGLRGKMLKFKKNISIESVHYPTLWNKQGISFLTLNYFWGLSFEKIARFSAPRYPTIRSCQTLRVINPSVMRTTVVLRKSIINGTLMALFCQSWSTKQLVRVSVSQGLMGLSPRPHVIDWKVRVKKIHSLVIGVSIIIAQTSLQKNHLTWV